MARRFNAGTLGPEETTESRQGRLNVPPSLTGLISRWPGPDPSVETLGYYHVVPDGTGHVTVVEQDSGYWPAPNSCWAARSGHF